VSGRIGAAFRRASSAAAGGVSPIVRGTPHAIFAAVIPAALLLGLDRAQVRDAVGIAGYSAHVPTLRKAMDLFDPPMTKYDHIGGMAQSGIDAARLASLGFTGDKDLFEGEAGMWRFSGALDCDWAVMAEFGGDWLIEGTFFKSYPVIIYENSVLRAVRHIVDEHGVQPEQIEALVLRPDRLTRTLQGDGGGSSMAQWRSLRHNAAHAICGTRPFSAWQTGEPPGPQIRALIERTTFEPYAPAPGEVAGKYYEGYSPASVTMRTSVGTFEARITHLQRLTEADLVAKFLENVTPVAGETAAHALVDLVLEVEKLPRAAAILETSATRAT
jgi:2-methylcitrate dehydratase PrpD